MTILRALDSSHSIFMIPGGRTWLNPSVAICSGIFQQVGEVSIQIQFSSTILSLFVMPPKRFPDSKVFMASLHIVSVSIPKINKVFEWPSGINALKI